MSNAELLKRADAWIRRSDDPPLVRNIKDADEVLEIYALIRGLAVALRTSEERIAALESSLRECLGTGDEKPGLYLLGCEAANPLVDDAETDSLIAEADAIEARARAALDPK